MKTANSDEERLDGDEKHDHPIKTPNGDNEGRW